MRATPPPSTKKEKAAANYPTRHSFILSFAHHYLKVIWVWSLPCSLSRPSCLLGPFCNNAMFLQTPTMMLVNNIKLIHTVNLARHRFYTKECIYLLLCLPQWIPEAEFVFQRGGMIISSEHSLLVSSSSQTTVLSAVRLGTCLFSRRCKTAKPILPKASSK